MIASCQWAGWTTDMGYPLTRVLGAEVAHLRPANPTVGIVPLHGRGSTGPRFSGRRFGDLADRPIPGLACLWPTATGDDGTWAIPSGHGAPSDVPLIEACVAELRAWGCRRVWVPGESAGAAMAWFLAAYRPTLADGYAPCNYPIQPWVMSQSYRGVPLYHELGSRDHTAFASPADVDVAGVAARGWLGMPAADPSRTPGVRVWCHAVAQVRIGARWGHAWRPAAHRRIAAIALEI